MNLPAGANLQQMNINVDPSGREELEILKAAFAAQLAAKDAEAAAQLAAKDAEAAAQLAAKDAQLAAEREQFVAELAAKDAQIHGLTNASSSAAASYSSASNSKGATSSESDSKESKNAFACEFIDTNNVQKRLLAHLQKATLEANVNYVALVQGSGYGKTRTIIETCRTNRLLSVYMCFRAEGSTGFPGRGEFVDEVLRRIRNSDAEAGFKAIGKLLSGIVCAVEKRVLHEDFDPTSFAFLPFGLTNEFGIDNEFWRDALECKDCLNHGEFSKSRLDAVLSRLNSALDSVKIIFIWDESRALIYGLGSAANAPRPTDSEVSAFRLLRRVIKSAEYGCSVSVFLDTSSLVSNFLPPAIHDSSTREDLRLYLPPFIHIGQSQSALVTHSSRNSSGPNVIQFNRESLLELRGRALWLAYRSVGRSNYRLVSLAHVKFNAESLSPSSYDISMSAACGIAASVAQLDISPVSSLASDLVHSHLGTLIAVSEDRKATLVGYPSEPVVARAALMFLHSPACSRVLEGVARALSQGLTLTTAGATGELVSRLYLLLHRSAPQEERHFAIVPKETLESFFGSLIGSVCAFVTPWPLFSRLLSSCAYCCRR